MNFSIKQELESEIQNENDRNREWVSELVQNEKQCASFVFYWTKFSFSFCDFVSWMNDFFPINDPQSLVNADRIEFFWEIFAIT